MASRFSVPSKLLPALTALVFLITPALATAQLLRIQTEAQADTTLPLDAEPAPTIAATADTTAIPDAPSTVFSASNANASFSADPAYIPPFGAGQFGNANHSDLERAKHPASVTDKYILPGQIAPKLTTGNKIKLGLIHSVSVYSILGWFVSSGYSHVLDGSPNYGTDSGAYGERLGASALRGVTTELFKDSVTAPIFHQDPRYYKMGPRRNIVIRASYAASRILVTRADDGRTAPNYSLVSGHLLGAALTNAYYPEANRGFGQTARTFGSSMYGAAFSFFAREFLIGTLITIHLKQNQD